MSKKDDTAVYGIPLQAETGKDIEVAETFIADEIGSPGEEQGASAFDESKARKSGAKVRAANRYTKNAAKPKTSVTVAVPSLKPNGAAVNLTVKTY
jgi:hypothetical protein